MTNISPLAVKVRNLNKSFGDVRAVDNISLDVHAGEILGVLGPNGAGKTTFLNILSTLLVPDSGTVHVLGLPLQERNSRFLRQHLNMCSGYPNFPWSLTVEENLCFYGRLYGLSGKALHSKVDSLIEQFDLNKVVKRRFDMLSSGNKQRMALAKAFLNDPKILFLDEPTIGLDPDVSLKIRGMLKTLLRERKTTVLLTTHYMPEAEAVCDRVAFINDGRILSLATAAELKTKWQQKDLEGVFLALSKTKDMQSVVPASDEPLMTPMPVNTDRGRQCRWWLLRVWAFATRNYLFAARNVFAFVELVFWPMVTLLSVGLLGHFWKMDTNAQSFVLTGALAAGILQVAQLDVAYSLLYEVWSKSLKQTFLTPTGESEHLFGSWIIGIARGLIICTVLTISAVYMFHFQIPPGPSAWVLLAGLFANALLLGMLVGILILTFGQKAEITAWMFSYLFMLICGIYYPVDVLPTPLKILAECLPITYFLEYFRAHLGFAATHTHLLAKACGLWLMYAALGLWAMKHAFVQARRKGTLVRLSE